MDHKISSHILPTSGEMIGMIVKAFRLNHANIGGPDGAFFLKTSPDKTDPRYDKTAQRYFAGVRIDHDKADLLARQFGKALFHSRILGDFEGTVQAEDRLIEWETVFERAASFLSKAWDHEFWQSAVMFPRADVRLATLIFARQVIIELALRHACLVMMGKKPAPSEDCPWWATEKCLGSFLNSLKDGCEHAISGSAIAIGLGGKDDSTVDRWLSGKEIPNLEHTDALARFFASRLPDGNEKQLLRDLRGAVGVASLVHDLRDRVGQDAVTRLGQMHVRLVRWTLEMAAPDASTDPFAQDLFAGIMVLGTAHPSNGPVLLEWAKRVREIPWMDDILKSHPADRATRLKESLRVVGEAEKRGADLQEVMPDATEAEREMISECAAWKALATHVFTSEEVEKNKSALQNSFQNPALDAEIAMLQASQARYNHDFKTACVHAARAVQLQPDRADYRYFLGCYLSQAHHWSEAHDQLQKACELRPDWDRPYVEIAIAYANRGLADSAIHHLEHGPPAMRESSAWFQFNLGKLYVRSNDYERGLKCLESSTKLDTNAGAAFDLAADAAFRLGQHAKGKKLAKEAKYRGIFDTFKRWKNGEYLPL